MLNPDDLNDEQQPSRSSHESHRQGSVPEPNTAWIHEMFKQQQCILHQQQEAFLKQQESFLTRMMSSMNMRESTGPEFLIDSLANHVTEFRYDPEENVTFAAWCRCSLGLLALSICGFILSMYTSYVEVLAENDHSYKALCDISERISCTKVFTSCYGRGFGVMGKIFGDEFVLNIPNGFFGIFHYLIVAALSISDDLRISRLNRYLILIANTLSLYLAFILYFVIQDLCIVCVTTYAINLFCLFLVQKKIQVLNNIVLDIEEKH
ncbi:vitamin K epoxide reductase complex subunit 1 [Anopheles nili]|uniref:vitamin K epoxide reductase complex subunit 1 n=1 Tax=Anopheles nili TaxID=185578 RepID=UPI00237B7E02|nr:vitamin K epoxide reductase complex subunit 1 [Anopheles nili]